MIRIKQEAPEATTKLLVDATTRAAGLLTNTPILFRTIDRRISRHIAESFRRGGVTGKRWKDLAEATLEQRKGAIQGNAKASYYAKNRHRVSAPLKPRSWHWTLASKRAALMTGKITGKSLVKDFGGESSFEHKKLRWFHYGGPHRPARPIYVRAEVDKIALDTTKQFYDIMFAGGEAHVVRRDF